MTDHDIGAVILGAFLVFLLAVGLWNWLGYQWVPRRPGRATRTLTPQTTSSEVRRIAILAAFEEIGRTADEIYPKG